METAPSKAVPRAGVGGEESGPEAPSTQQRDSPGEAQAAFAWLSLKVRAALPAGRPHYHQPPGVAWDALLGRALGGQFSHLS